MTCFTQNIRKFFITLSLAFAVGVEARPAFQNSDFEKGSFENWNAENWCIVTPELFGDTRARFQKNGMYAAVSLRERGERILAAYEKTGQDKLVRTLISSPFTATERFLQFQLALTPFPNEKAKYEIGIDTDFDGKIDLKLNPGVIRRQLCFFDLKNYQNKQVRFIARVTGASCVLDNFLLLPAVTPEVFKGTEFSEGNSFLGYITTLHNHSTALAMATLEVTVKDYFNQVVFTEKRPVSIPAKGRKKETFRWPLSCGKKYRINILVRAADGAVVEQLAQTLYPAHISDGRNVMQIPESGWEHTISGNKILEMPPDDAEWNTATPFHGSNSYYWRNPKWKPAATTAQQWFRRTIEVPETFFEANRHIILSFDNGGGGLTNLFINGKNIAEDWHLYPYVRKEMDVTDFIKPGRNEFIFRLRNPMFYTPGDMTRKIFEYPVFVHNQTPMSGILGKLYLENREAVSVNNCYIDSWMTPERVDLRVNLINRSSYSRKAKIQSRILDSSGKVLAVLPEKTGTVPANSMIQLKSSSPVNNLPRWTIDTPNLLQMEISCITSEGTDIYRERFGFHEYSYKGRQFLLNGIPVSILECLTQHHGLVADWKKWWGANAIRRAVCPEQLDAGDEEGFFQRMVQEDIYPGTVTPNPPVLPESYIKPFSDMEMAQVDYYYNHPSFYMFNLGNELDGHGYFRTQTRSYYERLFGGIAEKIYALDPQRAVAGSGDAIADFFRRRAWSVHYPYEYGIAHDLPNSGKLLSEKHPLHVLAPNMPWDGKPVFCGENFSESGVGPYLASFGGDMPDTMANWFSVWRDFFRIRSRSMRMDGISSMAPFTPIMTLRHYYPVELFVSDYKEQYFAGTQMNLPVTIMHDNFLKEKLQLVWRVGDQSGETSLDFAPGERKNVRLPAITLPEKSTVLPIRLELLKNGKSLQPQAIWNGKISVIEKYNAKGKVAGVFHGDEALKELLRYYGFTVKAVRSSDIPPDISFIVTTRLPENTSALKEWTAQGNTLMVMLNRPGVYRVANQNVQVRSHKDSHTFNIAEHDPMTTGLDNTLLRYWRNTDCRVMENAMVRPDSADCRSLMLCGDSSGLNFSSLLTEKNGRGTVVYTTLLMNECGKNIPAVGLLLRNAAKLFVQKATPRVAALVRDSWLELLQANSIAVTDLATANDPAQIMRESSIVLIDGAANTDETQLLKFVQNGGTLVLWRVTDETLARYTNLIGSGVKLVRTPDDNSNALVGIQVRSPLLNGISNGDLSWRRGRIMFIAGGRDMRSTITSMADFWYEFTSKTEWNALTKPVALAERKFGNGRIILDQIRWDVAGTEAPEALRTALTWYRNLGIERPSGMEKNGTKYCRTAIDLPGNWGGEANALGIADAAKYFKNNPRAVILGSSTEFTDNPRHVTLNLQNHTFDRLKLDTANAFGYIDYSMNKIYAEVKLTYSDGTFETLDLRYGDHGDDIRVRSAAPLGNAEQIAAMEDNGISIYQTIWRNPHPEKPVKFITISSIDEKIVPVIFSVTMETRQNSIGKLKRRRTGVWSITDKIRDTTEAGTRIWAVGGPFENNWTGNVEAKPKAFDQKFSPEYEVDLSKLLRVSYGLTSWKKYSEKFNTIAPQIIMSMNPENVLDFKDSPRDRYCAYFFTKVYSPKKQKVLIAFGSDDAGKIWLNGKLIHSHWVLRGTWLGDDIIETTLEKGWNTVLIKLIQMRLGVGVAFDIKPWFENWQTVPGRTIGAKPSLELQYDAYAASNIEIPGAFTMRECGRTQIMSGTFSNSGIFVERDADGSNAILLDYSYAGNQFVTIPYKQFMQHGKFKNGIFSMEFKISSINPPRGKIHLAGRNAGGSHIGDIQIELNPDIHGTPGKILTLWWECGNTRDNLRKLVLPLNRVFPDGFPLDRYIKLNISWGELGFKIGIDNKTLLEEKDNNTPCFTSPVHLTFGYSSMPEGRLYLRKMSLMEQ